jgi:hypothetical protein
MCDLRWYPPDVSLGQLLRFKDNRPRVQISDADRRQITAAQKMLMIVCMSIALHREHTCARDREGRAAVGDMCHDQVWVK